MPAPTSNQQLIIMLYPLVIDSLQFSPNAASISTTTASTIVARIKQEPKRLEGILLVCKATTSATAIANNYGLGAMIKEIRLRANDVLGSRNVVQVTGPALLGLNRQNFGFLDRNTAAATTSANLATSTAYTWCYFIPLRHPCIAEPYGNLLSLPLSSNFLKDDAQLEVDINSQNQFAGPNSPSTITVKAFTLLRSIPDNATVPYLPSELRTDLFAPAIASKISYDLPTVGFLTQALVQGRDGTLVSSAAASVISASGALLFEYGRNIMRRLDDDGFTALNDLSAPATKTPGESVFSSQYYIGEYMIDFLTDYFGQDAFSAASLINLNTDALLGDKARITFNDFANASYAARITTHKILARTAEAIKPLMLAI